MELRITSQHFHAEATFCSNASNEPCTFGKDEAMSSHLFSAPLLSVMGDGAGAGCMQPVILKSPDERVGVLRVPASRGGPATRSEEKITNCVAGTVRGGEE